MHCAGPVFGPDVEIVSARRRGADLAAPLSCVMRRTISRDSWRLPGRWRRTARSFRAASHPAPQNGRAIGSGYDRQSESIVVAVRDYACNGTRYRMTPMTDRGAAREDRSSDETGSRLQREG